MKKALLVLLCLAAGFFGATVAVRTYTPGISHESAYDRVMRTGTLRLGYFVWPPFVERDVQTGQLSGYTVDYATAVVKNLRLGIDWVEIAFDERIAALQTGKVDAIALEGSIVGNSSSIEAFSQPLFVTPIDIWALASDERFASTKVSELNKPDIRISMMDADISEDFARRLLPQAKPVSLAALSDPSQMMLDIVSGKADLVINDAITLLQFNQSNNEKFRKVTVTPLGYWAMQMATAREIDTRLLNMIDQAIINVQLLGEADAINAPYQARFGSDFIPATLHH